MQHSSFSLTASSGRAVRRNAAQMFPLVEWQLESGLNQKQFCLEQGLPLYVFSYWLRKYREENAVEPGFVALNPAYSGPLVPIRLQLGSGHSLEISTSVPANYLAELIRHLD